MKGEAESVTESENEKEGRDCREIAKRAREWAGWCKDVKINRHRDIQIERQRQIVRQRERDREREAGSERARQRERERTR